MSSYLLEQKFTKNEETLDVSLRISMTLKIFEPQNRNVGLWYLSSKARVRPKPGPWCEGVIMENLECVLMITLIFQLLK